MTQDIALDTEFMRSTWRSWIKAVVLNLKIIQNTEIDEKNVGGNENQLSWLNLDKTVREEFNIHMIKSVCVCTQMHVYVKPAMKYHKQNWLPPRYYY